METYKRNSSGDTSLGEYNFSEAGFQSMTNSDFCSATLQVMHYSAIHEIRNFAIQGGFGVVVQKVPSLKPYENIANACRTTFATVLKVRPTSIHCTISYCGSGEDIAKRNVWNFAHSEPAAGRTLRLGPDEPTTVEKNSCYAAILGCKDIRGNDWKYRHKCFACDDLKENIYASDEKDWPTWYCSKMVFPLCFRTPNKKGGHTDYITGFLEFECNPGLLQVPSIFCYMDKTKEYWDILYGLALCNTGAIIADSIATAIFLEKKSSRIVKKVMENTHGTK